MVQTATNQEVNTQYNYDGSGVDVSPTDAGNNKSEALGQGAFPSNSIDPAAVASALESAVRDSGENDAQVTSATIAKDNADQPQPTLIVNLNGPHGSKSLRYDLSGHLIAVL